MSICKITSVDVGSTHSQIAQAYWQKGDTDLSWKVMNHPNAGLLHDNGTVNIPTVLFRRSDLSNEQQMVVNVKRDVLGGTEAIEIFKRHYDVKILSEFKKDFFCSEEAKSDPVILNKYNIACNAYTQYLKFLKELLKNFI